MDLNAKARLLKLLATAAFALSAVLLGIVVYQSSQAEKRGAHQYRDPSQRRGEKRREACLRSPLYAMFLALLRGPAGIVSRFEIQSLRRYVHEPYIRAGYPGGMDDDEIVAVGLILSVICGAVTAFVVMSLVDPRWALLGVPVMPLGFFSLIANLQNRAEKRQRQILMAMPYVLNLLVLILRSGTSLNLALARVVADYAHHPVGEELGQMLSEIEMGSPRAQAVRRLAERIGQSDITSLADSMVQSEELGWPLADTLARQADRIAAERILAAQAKAGAAGVWVMLPSTLVLMGAVLLLFAPILVRFLRGGLSLK